jgi:hypothetical protein
MPAKPLDIVVFIVGIMRAASRPVKSNAAGFLKQLKALTETSTARHRSYSDIVSP